MSESKKWRFVVKVSETTANINVQIIDASSFRVCDGRLEICDSSELMAAFAPGCWREIHRVEIDLAVDAIKKIVSQRQ